MKIQLNNPGFLPEQIWVRLPDPTALPLSDMKILGKNLPIYGGKNCQFREVICQFWGKASN